jgi:hypothetical protein
MGGGELIFPGALVFYPNDDYVLRAERIDKEDRAL